MEHIKDAIPFQEKLVLQGVCEKDTVRVYTGLDAVSYTHLDVYKRQVHRDYTVEFP